MPKKSSFKEISIITLLFASLGLFVMGLWSVGEFLIRRMING